MKELNENLEQSLKAMKTNYEEQIYKLTKEKTKLENSKHDFINSNASNYEYQIQMLTKSLSTKDQNYAELDKKYKDEIEQAKIARSEKDNFELEILSLKNKLDFNVKVSSEEKISFEREKKLLESNYESLKEENYLIINQLNDKEKLLLQSKEDLKNSEIKVNEMEEILNNNKAYTDSELSNLKVQLERINSSTSEIKIENKILKESQENVSRKLKDTEQNMEKMTEKFKMKKQKIKKLQCKIESLKNMKKQSGFLNTYSAFPSRGKAAIFDRGKIIQILRIC